MPTQSNNPPTKYGIILFPDFQSLDVFGPLDVLNVLSRTVPFQLSIIAETLSPVSTKSNSPGGATIGQSVIPTHTFENAPEDIEVLIVPGGKGTRDLEATQLIVDYVRKAYPKLKYLFTVCTGSTLAARAGILDGHEATSNKGSFTWSTAQGPNVKWIHEARWVTSGNIWTSSGISAGIDMMYAFIADQFGEDVAARIAIASEYTRNIDPKSDPFAQYSG